MSSMSYTVAETTTFTLTHAKHISAKVATDLKRIQRFYGYPSDSSIDSYEKEIIELLKAGFLEKVTYGFKRNGNWIEPTLCYTAKDLSSGSSIDEDPGKVRPGANITNASFYSYLTYSPSWNQQSLAQRETFKQSLPFQRSSAAEPSINGYLEGDRTYSSGGRALDRATIRSY